MIYSPWFSPHPPVKNSGYSSAFSCFVIRDCFQQSLPCDICICNFHSMYYHITPLVTGEVFRIYSESWQAHAVFVKEVMKTEILNTPLSSSAQIECIRTHIQSVVYVSLYVQLTFSFTLQYKTGASDRLMAVLQLSFQRGMQGFLYSV